MLENSFDWSVIGAGPAGIAAVGKLLDHGVSPEKIAWIDPTFTVGDFGTKWHHVSSNTKINFFIKFYQACDSFLYTSAAHQFRISQLNQEETCLLSIAAEPLQWITDHLIQKVSAWKNHVSHLQLKDHYWHLSLSNQILRAKNVILAIGGEPKTLAYPNTNIIPLDIALDPEKLASTTQPSDQIAIFGSSHSAIIIIKTLLEQCHIQKVMNFYLEPLRYAVYFDDWTFFDDTGLKGETAEWARKHLHGVIPEKLARWLSTEENIQTYLPQCNKVIYTTGFQKRAIPIEGMNTISYNNRNGIIAPGLFGVGIAFPEAKLDRYGTLEYRVGLWKFMDYITHVMPLWLRYGV